MQCLASQNQVELLMLEKKLNLTAAIDGTKIKKLENVLGEVTITKVITYLLMRFSDNFNVSKKLTAAQAPLIAIDIIEKYPYETIEDIILMLKQVRQGIIGDGKDYKLDGQNILNKWFPEYLDNKYAEVERLNKQVDIEPTKNDAVTIFYQQQRDKKAIEMRDKKVHAEIDKMAKNMNRQKLEDTIKDWSQKEDMKPYVDYLKNKRRQIPGDWFD